MNSFKFAIVYESDHVGHLNTAFYEWQFLENRFLPNNGHIKNSDSCLSRVMSKS